MQNSHPYKKHQKFDAALSASENKMLSHLSGINIVKEGEMPADIQADTEIYNLSILPTFILCACYLGYGNYIILGEGNIEIPIDLIWDLFNFTSGLTAGKQITDRHMMIMEKTFELLGYHTDLSVKDQDVFVVDGIEKISVREYGKTKYVGFDGKGINPDIFSQMLAHALLHSNAVDHRHA